VGASFTGVGSTATRAQAAARRAGDRALSSAWARRLARLGFASRALVYAVIGALALLAALGRGGDTTDSRGAIAVVASQPHGAILAALLAAGLAALGLRFALEGALDPERTRRGAKGAVVRVAKVFGGLLYVGLAAWAAQLASGAASGPSGDEQVRSYTARALALPAGRLLVAIAGVVALAVAVHQLRNGWKRWRGDLDLRSGEMPRALRRAAPGVGLAGFGAQGLVILLIGVFWLQAAFVRDADEATGFDGALAFVARQPWGAALLAVLAAGLLAYAAWSAIEARYKPLPR
jgi:hypothetical protein